MSLRVQLWPTLFSILGLAILIALGTWQLNRYLDARQFEEEQQQRMDEPIAELSTDDLGQFGDGDFDFRRVTVEGTFDERRIYLINHRVYDGEPGYWVVRPLFVDVAGADEPKTLPVNQGWLHREDGYDAAEALLADTPEDAVEVTGLVHRLDEVIADDEFRELYAHPRVPSGIGVHVLDTYDVNAIGGLSPKPRLAQDRVLVESPDHADPGGPQASYDHVTDPYLTADTHFGYMLTWYSLAVALIAIWFANAAGVLRSRSFGEQNA